MNSLATIFDHPGDGAQPEQTVQRFAWTPIKLSTGHWIIWRRYESTEHWLDGDDWGPGYWVPVYRRIPLTLS